MQEGEQRVQGNVYHNYLWSYGCFVCDLMVVFFNEFIFSCDVSNKHIYLITREFIL